MKSLFFILWGIVSICGYWGVLRTFNLCPSKIFDDSEPCDTNCSLYCQGYFYVSKNQRHKWECVNERIVESAHHYNEKTKRCHCGDGELAIKCPCHTDKQIENLDSEICDRYCQNFIIYTLQREIKACGTAFHMFRVWTSAHCYRQNVCQCEPDYPALPAEDYATQIRHHRNRSKHLHSPGSWSKHLKILTHLRKWANNTFQQQASSRCESNGEESSPDKCLLAASKKSKTLGEFLSEISPIEDVHTKPETIENLGESEGSPDKLAEKSKKSRPLREFLVQTSAK